MQEKFLYGLKEEKNKLEFALMEKQFHYDSIPKRKKQTTQELVLVCCILVPVLACTIYAAFSLAGLVERIQDIKEGPVESSVINIMGIPFLANCILIALGVALLFPFIRKVIALSTLLVGKKGNTQLYGFSNYKQEETIVKGEIRDLIDRIGELEQEITRVKETFHFADEKYKPKENEERLSLQEQFLLHAYGTWGDTKEQLIMKYNSHETSREIEELTGKIRENEKKLRMLGEEKLDIAKRYENIQLRFLFLFALLCFMEIVLLSVPDSLMQLYIGIGMAVGFFLMFVLCVRFSREDYLRYRAEKKFEKVKTYATEQHIKPTEMRRKEYEEEILRWNKRLEYLHLIEEMMPGIP
ncbi:MAG: hypothetical protein ACI4DU_08230 [Lachnospiraceae bacterium]